MVRGRKIVFRLAAVALSICLGWTAAHAWSRAKAYLGILLIVVSFVGCAGIQLSDVTNSMFEKAGAACYGFMPQSRLEIDSLCSLKQIIDSGTIDPAEAQKLITEKIGGLWVVADNSSLAAVQLLLNDFVRFSQLKAENPTKELLTVWSDALNSFCLGVAAVKGSASFFDHDTRLVGLSCVGLSTGRCQL